jgi:hypothetical protein
MSHALSPQNPVASMRRSAARLWADPDSRGVLIGLGAVVFIHLFLFAVSPYLLRTDTLPAMVKKHAAPPQFNIEIAPDEFVRPQPKPPPPNRFVESNPNAPENIPDKTNNFSNKNSQLAQEKPQLEKNTETPKLDGKKDVESNQVVSGQLVKPVETAPVPPQPLQTQKTQQAARQLQNPLSGFDKTKEGDDGFGSNIGKVPDQAIPVPEKVDGSAESKLKVGAVNAQPAIDPRHPRSRPMLNNTQSRPAIFKDNEFGTRNIGAVSYDAKWSNYGAYLHKMLEAIQYEWDRILIESQTYPPAGSWVTVKFTIDKKGKITDIGVLESTSSEQGKQSCPSAITMAAPYGDWSDDMIKMLGESQDITINFYYQ